MNRLTTAKRSAVIACLVEGNSIRSTVRMTGVCKKAVTRLLVEVGSACASFQDKALRDLRCERVQIDEAWSFIGAKQKNVTPAMAEKNPAMGDAWVWLALCADTKLAICAHVGPRRPRMAYRIVEDVRFRVATVAPQITTDGLPWYADAIEKFFGIDVHYARLMKNYGGSGDTQTSARYSPAKLKSITTEVIKGTPDPAHISTSYIERANLTMRMGMRRFTRLTNGFSRKLDNHEAAVQLHFAYYNLCRVHQTLRITPAMAAGVTQHVWSIEELVGLLDQVEKKAA